MARSRKIKQSRRRQMRRRIRKFCGVCLILALALVALRIVSKTEGDLP